MDDHYELLIIDGMPIAPFKSILKKDKHLIENIVKILYEIGVWSKDNLILPDLNLHELKNKRIELKTMKGQLSKDLVHQLKIILDRKKNREPYLSIYYKHKYNIENQRVRFIEEFGNINVIQDTLERMKKLYTLEKYEIDIDIYHMKQNRLNKIEQVLKEIKVSYNIDFTNHQEQEEGLDDILYLYGDDIHDDICSRIISILPLPLA